VETKDGAVFKQRTTRYLDANGRRVGAGTPGSRRVVVESRKWYGRVQDPGTREWRLVPLSKDKQVARKKLADFQTELERGEAGLVDPYKQAKEAPATEHVEAYLTDLGERGRSERYRKQTRRDIEKVLAACKAQRLADLTADKVNDFLTGLTCSARTKNSYRQAVLGMYNFLVRKKKLPHNPLLLTTRRKGEAKRKRRALSPEGLQRLLDAARQRPLVEAMTVRRGPRKGRPVARVKPEQRERLERIGRQRSLLYLTAVHTGLRLGALRGLKVGYLHLDSMPPRMELPGRLMKSGRDFKQRIRDDLAAELKAWLAETGKEPADNVFDIPAYSQVSKLLRKDLRKADIPYRDVNGRYFDFHSFRKCTGSFLRQAKVDPSLSMKHLDHSDIRMTMVVYNDEDLLDAEEAVNSIPRLAIR
jgi:integrase